MDIAMCFALFIPLLGFLFLVACSGHIQRHSAGIVACSTIFLSFLTFAVLLGISLYTGQHREQVTLFNWIPMAQMKADFALALDPLSFLMCLIVTGVSFLIHVYSIGYMEEEPDFARYFAFLNFFVFAMLLLALAGDLLLLFVGWEGVGIASYLLIGFWYERPKAAAAATKAFVVNRIGDLGLLLAILLSFHLFGTTNMDAMFGQAIHQFSPDSMTMTILTALLFIGAMGKSAQLPLHIWLADAMEGPTPVSALIHAATMVTAGVYLVVRMHPLFLLAPDTLMCIGVIGGVTSLFAALAAVGQSELKRVLAYSTISQLGLMFLACGVGAFYAAMFHLMTHAFMKALLFLSAGNVIHMLHGKIDMKDMGGLSKVFTKTHIFFLIGVFAMAGIPPLAAFFSKDLILEQEYEAGFKTLFYIGITSSLLTGFYLMRAYCLTFLGPLKIDSSTPRSLNEAPQVMLWPVGILAFLSLTAGFMGFAFGKKPFLERFLAEVGVTLSEPLPPTDFIFSFETWLSIFVAVLGVGGAFLLYTRFKGLLGSPIAILQRAFYLDEIFWYGIAYPLRWVSKFVGSCIEPKIFEGMLQLVAHSAQGIAKEFQKLQNGQIRSYAALMVVGSLFLLLYLSAI